MSDGTSSSSGQSLHLPSLPSNSLSFSEVKKKSSHGPKVRLILLEDTWASDSFCWEVTWEKVFLGIFAISLCSPVVIHLDISLLWTYCLPHENNAEQGWLWEQVPMKVLLFWILYMHNCFPPFPEGILMVCCSIRRLWWWKCDLQKYKEHEKML